MNLENILEALIGFVIIIVMYLVIISCVNEYRWRKLKRHVIEAIEALNLWDFVNRQIPLNANAFRSITTFLDDHKYKHRFHEHGGAFWLVYTLNEIRKEHDQS